MWKNLTRDQRTARVSTLALDGWSAGSIAVHLGTTRNAIIGHASKKGIQLHGKPTGIKGKMHQPIRSPLMDASPNDPPLAGSTPTSLLKTTGCRWPVEGGFCNGGIHSKSYCETHYDKAYRPRLPVHPLITLLTMKGPQKPLTKRGADAYRGLVNDRLVSYRTGSDGLKTFYLNENTPGY